MPNHSTSTLASLTNGGAEYSHALLPPGTTTCPAGAKTSTPVVFDESIGKDPSALDAGQGLSGLPGSILSMTGSPQTLINPAVLPVDPKTCKPVYPSRPQPHDPGRRPGHLRAELPDRLDGR